MRASVWERVEAVLIGAGTICLAAYLWTAIERNWYQSLYLSRHGESSAAPAGSRAGTKQPLREGVLARIDIPRSGVSAAVLDGVDSRTLRRAVGHVPGTAYPGEDGRIVLAAHRDTFFGRLHLLKRDDRIKLTTGGLTREYAVEKISVVRPEQTEVMAPTTHPTLTLVTCYPFHFVGQAPERFVVDARLREWPHRGGQPALMPAKATGRAGGALRVGPVHYAQNVDQRRTDRTGRHEAARSPVDPGVQP